MLRIILLASVTLAIAASSSAATITPHVASCGNSFPADGHNGPWRTTNNGGTLHGNTIHIDCPTGSTHWHVNYCVQGMVPGSGFWVNAFCTERSGNGSPSDWSASINPYGCDQNVYRTHVVNLVTGGTANKPSGGGGVDPGC